ncbi:MAG TPA: hypothetical protein VF705_10180 [Longimicrobium sp.]|jgi:hypothetical protein
MYDSDDEGREFGERMREAFDRLRADPAAWQDYVDEVASITPLLYPSSFGEPWEPLVSELP